MTTTKHWRFKCFIALAWTQFFSLTAIATYFMLTPSPGDSFASVWDKALHFACWFILLLSLQLPWLFRPKLWWAALALFLYSALIETLQQLSPPREFSLADIFANGLGIVSALIILLLVHPFLQRLVVKRLHDFLLEKTS